MSFSTRDFFFAYSVNNLVKVFMFV